MNEKELMRAMTDMNEDFIEEAEKAVEKAQAKPYASAKTAKPEEDRQYIRIRKPSRKVWKWAGGIAAALIVCVIGAGMFGGRMGGAKSASTAAPAASTPAMSSSSSSSAAGSSQSAYYGKGEGYFVNDMAVSEDWGWNEAEMPAASESASYASNKGDSAGNIEKSNMKLIYRANLSLQTTDFDETEAQIKAMAENYGGYIQDSWFNTGGYYSAGNYKEGQFTVRVPAEHYKEFVNAVGDSCHVTSISENIEDVGLEYYETEARLETLRTKEKRLQELLAEASGLSDIIQLENALSDTEYQIDMYTSQLNCYDSLVGYSTVSITLSQVEKPQDPIKQDNSFGARLKRAFENGWDNFVWDIESFVIDLSYSIFGIITFAVIVVAAFFIIRAIVRKVKKNKAKESAEAMAKLDTMIKESEVRNDK